jgi:hypothetical protein
VPLILDPSQTILASSSLKPKNKKTKEQKPRLEDDEEERAFRDSRGSRASSHLDHSHLPSSFPYLTFFSGSASPLLLTLLLLLSWPQVPELRTAC